MYKILITSSLVVSLGVFAGLPNAYGQEDTVNPSAELGAITYQQRCTLCHGTQGRGEGILPIAMKKYPNTNLMEPQHGNTSGSIRKAILYGGINGSMSNEMPPFADELTYQQIESLVMFIQLMHKDHKQAMVLMKTVDTKQTPTVKLGQNIFKTRCTICHGAEGKGDGKLSRIIKDPAPFNLTKSTIPTSAAHDIVMQGGLAVNRSARMPPWKDELTPVEIDSVVLYIMTLRQ